MDDAIQHTMAPCAFSPESPSTLLPPSYPYRKLYALAPADDDDDTNYDNGSAVRLLWPHASSLDIGPFFARIEANEAKLGDVKLKQAGRFINEEEVEVEVEKHGENMDGDECGDEDHDEDKDGEGSVVNEETHWSRGSAGRRCKCRGGA